MTIQHLYPTTRPSLDLNFARQKRLDPRVTFTRGSTATYVGSDGLIKTAASNEARFDHDPTTGESLGLLVEESRTNIIPTSAPTTSQLTNIYSWITMADGFTAPDGTSSAVKLTSTEATDQHSTNRGVNSSTSYSMPTTGDITVSVYVKPLNSSAKVTLAGPAGNAGYYGAGGTAVDFTVSPPTVTINTTNGFVSGACTDVGNGWYRLHYVFDLDNSGTTPGGTTTGPRVNPYGAGTEALFWGLQMEAGTFPTSYIPTSGSTVTRSADVASMTGTNFSSWYNQNEGTMLSVSNNILFGGGLWYFGPSGAPRWWSRYERTNGIRTQAYDGSGGSGVVDITIPGVTGNATVPTLKHCVAISNTEQEHSGSANGSAVVTGSWDSINGVASLTLGRRNDLGGNSGYLNATLARLTYYPFRLTDAQLQALTL